MKLSIPEIEKKIKPILVKYGITTVSVTGSVARGEHTDGSDIDMIVDINNPISLLTFSRIKLELEAILKIRVDLVERSAIKPRLKKYMLKDEIRLSV